ncbi:MULTISPECIES: hypothetical protein [unclassified Polaromonas]|jgi:hypothetical protein|uniref:hypothetical protein n=1 Tax=unclassified Polaromonas TaxID=2638319 RepID=UPI000BC77D52|nr:MULTISPECIES: hypothetical protein [unclassified Polaromonas]OYY34748.1 MAG: hypothetical protein B7Y60_15005 [Polaromonas sp. 35-63-35]OYZ19367.1 MAG: hypothetical protein B7Y28_12585 [Polaromonas sp. 16-63-31]OYZ77508.1 MAG: hypothetical protein B7Y09_16155 [Polaromonas sp. 24-63-21]OZA48508.1 MAG: hypothetical protein B7X88_18355 [Polaromonas sp. 17-63-33]OZA87258.1 MAG: hypothetical protein B7X65_13835 [Polaromonas sp. 39-63-25]
MQEHLTIDIETIPAQRTDVLEEIRESKQTQLSADIEAIRAPGNYKDADKIAAWLSNEGQQKAQALRDAFDADVDAAYRKTGLDGAYGQICVIGFAVDNDAPRTVWSAEWNRPDCERELLEDFYIALGDAISPSAERSITVIGHNVASFDLRFMVQRSIVKGIRPHGVISRASQAKPWETDKVFDTMVQWAGVGNRISLDKLCKALGIQSPKGDITGATVWDAVKAGRIAEVADYCKKDVSAVRMVHRRLTFATNRQEEFV